jgi:hypothetical protein
MLKRRRRKARSDSLAASTGITPDFYVPDDWVTSDLALPAAKEALKRAAANPKTLTFWCDAKATRKGMPTSDPALCRTVSVETGLVRTCEPGLSIVVPLVLPDIEPRHLTAAAVRNYYYPILTGRLVVEVDGTIIDATSFEAVSTSLGNEVVPAWMLAFVRELQDRRESAPDTLLPDEWQTKTITGSLLGPDTTEQLRETFKAGQMVSVRAPLSIVPRGAHRSEHMSICSQSA